MSRPFRWNVAKREQLGTLVERTASEPYPGFVTELQHCCARIIALAGDADLVFIGRSPESIFDYLSGLLADTSWRERCVLVNISMRNLSPGEIRGQFPSAITNMREQFQALQLAPQHIAVRSRPVALVDLVANGWTFENIANFLLLWAHEGDLDEASVRRKLRFVGMTDRRKTSPNTWRWQQHAPWTKQFRGAIKNVSISRGLWTYLGDYQHKVSQWNPPWRWGAEELQRPQYDERTLEALRLALYLYTFGRSAEHRQAFARRLAAQPSMQQPWFRSLLREVRSTT